MHTGKELEAHKVQKVRLSCDSDAQVGNARSDSTRVVKVNRRNTNRRKTRPYCIRNHSIFTLYQLVAIPAWTSNCANVDYVYMCFCMQAFIFLQQYAYSFLVRNTLAFIIKL